MLRLPYKTRFYFIKIKSNRAVEMWCTRLVPLSHPRRHLLFSHQTNKLIGWRRTSNISIYHHKSPTNRISHSIGYRNYMQKCSLLTSSIRFVRSVAIFITECVWEQNLMKMKMKFNAISVQSNRLKWNYTRNECTKWEEKKNANATQLMMKKWKRGFFDMIHMNDEWRMDAWFTVAKSLGEYGCLIF